jgi:hypothetical protein
MLKKFKITIKVKYAKIAGNQGVFISCQSIVAK